MPERKATVLSPYLLAFCAVRRAALTLAAETVSEPDYERARRILTADPEAGEGRSPLPYARSLKRLVRGDWEAVLHAAVLPLPLASDAAQASDVAAAPGLAVEEAIACFWKVNGEFPSRTTLERFMAVCDARLANPRAGVRWHDYLDRARELLRRDGHEPTDTGPTPGRRVSFKVPPGASIPGALPQRRNRRRAVSRSRCRRALTLFTAEQRKAGLPISRQAYLHWRRGTDWPAPSSMAKFGGFGALVREVA